jgi:hypothetical protein
MLLAAVTRNSFPEFLVYCLTGAEEYWITIKPGRLLEPYVERHMVGARKPNFEGSYILAPITMSLLSAARSVQVPIHVSLSVRLPTVQLELALPFSVYAQDRTQYVFPRLSKQDDFLVHYTILQNNTSTTFVVLRYFSCRVRKPLSLLKFTERGNNHITSRSYVRLLLPDNPHTRSVALSL